MESSRSTTPPPSDNTQQQCPGAPQRPRLTEAERQARRFQDNLAQFVSQSEHNTFRRLFTRANLAMASFANDDSVVPNVRRSNSNN